MFYDKHKWWDKEKNICIYMLQKGKPAAYHQRRNVQEYYFAKWINWENSKTAIFHKVMRLFARFYLMGLENIDQGACVYIRLRQYNIRCQDTVSTYRTTNQPATPTTCTTTPTSCQNGNQSCFSAFILHFTLLP